MWSFMLQDLDATELGFFKTALKRRRNLLMGVRDFWAKGWLYGL